MNAPLATQTAIPELDLEAAYHAVSDTFRGPDLDIQALCRASSVRDAGEFNEQAELSSLIHVR